MHMLVDTHAHLDDEQFDDSRPDVMRRARDAGVTAVVAVGTTASSSRTCVDLAGQFNGVYAAVGIQPNYCQEAKSEDWATIVALATQDRVVAVGETGLDRHWDFTPFDVQQDYFDRHIRLAQQRDLPFVVHMRDCQEDILDMLRDAARRGPLRGVMHSYTGDAEMAVECVALGMHLSFAGMLTYKKSDALRAVAGSVPEGRILIETDCPYLSPHPKRGQRPNEPGLIVHTAACLAEVRRIEVGELAALTSTNARQLFRLEG